MGKASENACRAGLFLRKWLLSGETAIPRGQILEACLSLKAGGACRREAEGRDDDTTTNEIKGFARGLQQLLGPDPCDMSQFEAWRGLQEGGGREGGRHDERN